MGIQLYLNNRRASRQKDVMSEQATHNTAALRQQAAKLIHEQHEAMAGIVAKAAQNQAALWDMLATLARAKDEEVAEIYEAVKTWASPLADREKSLTAFGH